MKDLYSDDKSDWRSTSGSSTKLATIDFMRLSFKAIAVPTESVDEVLSLSVVDEALSLCVDTNILRTLSLNEFKRKYKKINTRTMSSYSNSSCLVEKVMQNETASHSGQRWLDPSAKPSVLHSLTQQSIRHQNPALSSSPPSQKGSHRTKLTQTTLLAINFVSLLTDPLSLILNDNRNGLRCRRKPAQSNTTT